LVERGRRRFSRRRRFATVPRHVALADRQEEGVISKRTDDYDEIVRVMQLYIDGANDNDVEKFKEAFHEDAWIFGIDPDGKQFKGLISQIYHWWATPPSWEVVGRIVSVTQVGDAAAVQLVWQRALTEEWIDFHNLLRIDGVWKITNKTATHSSR
jgi:hypothetical protein